VEVTYTMQGQRSEWLRVVGRMRCSLAGECESQFRQKVEMRISREEYTVLGRPSHNQAEHPISDRQETVVVYKSPLIFGRL
jgi:hypothetical protein